MNPLKILKAKFRPPRTELESEPREMTVADFQVPRRRVVKEWLDRWANLLVAAFVALALVVGYWWLT